MFERCQKCGKPLKTPESRMLGYGPVCYARVSEGIEIGSADAADASADS